MCRGGCEECVEVGVRIGERMICEGGGGEEGM